MPNGVKAVLPAHGKPVLVQARVSGKVRTSGNVSIRV
jgi:hypothetical protein